MNVGRPGTRQRTPIQGYNVKGRQQLPAPLPRPTL